MDKSIIVKGKENDVVFRLFENNNSINEIHIQIEGEKSWIVIGYGDLKMAIEKAENEFNIKKLEDSELIKIADITYNMEERTETIKRLI